MMQYVRDYLEIFGDDDNTIVTIMILSVVMACISPIFWFAFFENIGYSGERMESIVLLLIFGSYIFTFSVAILEFMLWSLSQVITSGRHVISRPITRRMINEDTELEDISPYTAINFGYISIVLVLGFILVFPLTTLGIVLFSASVWGLRKLYNIRMGEPE